MSVDTLDEYQALSKQTAVYPAQGTIDGLVYATLGANGEAGEIAEKVKKAIRDNGGVITEDRKEQILLEVGDCLWYLSRVCEELDTPLSRAAQMNLDKLFARRQRGAINGSGDSR